MRHNIHKTIYTQRVSAGQTAIVDGNFPASTSYIDVSEYRHFAFEIYVGSLNSAITAQVRQDTSATETAGIKDVTSATVTIGATDDDKTFVIEVDTSRLDAANGFRYVTLALSGAAGGDDYMCVVFRGFLARNTPVTQPTAFPAANYVLLG